MPIPVKTRPRFKCQFCLSYRATIKAVERHEGFCWQNPDRFCDMCENTGDADNRITTVNLESEEVFVRVDGKIPCPYCSKEDKAVTRMMADYLNDTQEQEQD